MSSYTCGALFLSKSESTKNERKFWSGGRGQKGNRARPPFNPLLPRSFRPKSFPFPIFPAIPAKTLLAQPWKLSDSERKSAPKYKKTQLPGGRRLTCSRRECFIKYLNTLHIDRVIYAINAIRNECNE